MKRVSRHIILVATAVALTAGLILYPKPARHVSAPLTQEAYIWQRAWTPAVREAAATSAADFSAYLVLAAEVSFNESFPQVARAAVDYASLKKAGSTASSPAASPSHTSR